MRRGNATHRTWATPESDEEKGEEAEQEDPGEETVQVEEAGGGPLRNLAVKLAENRYPDEDSARKVLETFEELGIETEDDLREFFRSSALPSLGGQAFQVLLTFIAANAAINLQFILANDPDAPRLIQLPLSFVLGATGFTLGLEALWSALLLGGAVATTVIWGSNPQSFLAAVRASAGDLAETGLGAVDRAAELARAVSVAQRLLDLQGLLGAELASDKSGENSTLDRLAAVLTLSNAREQYGFDAEKLGLDADEAVKLARTFGRFDRNNTGQLDKNDLADLARELGMELDADDAVEAVRMLDANENGVIEFSEFAAWYCRKIEIECTPTDGCAPVLGQPDAQQ